MRPVAAAAWDSVAEWCYCTCRFGTTRLFRSSSRCPTAGAAWSPWPATTDFIIASTGWSLSCCCCSRCCFSVTTWNIVFIPIRRCWTSRPRQDQDQDQDVRGPPSQIRARRKRMSESVITNPNPTPNPNPNPNLYPNPHSHQFRPCHFCDGGSSRWPAVIQHC